MKNPIVVLLMLLAGTATAQIKNFRISAGGVYPLIPNTNYSEGNTLISVQESSAYVISNSSYATIKEKHTGAVGIQLGGLIDYDLGKKIYLSAGIHLSYMRLGRSVEVSYHDVNLDVPSMGNYGTVIGTGFGIIRGASGEVYPTSENLSVLPSGDIGNMHITSTHLTVTVGKRFLNGKLAFQAGPSVSIPVYANVDQTGYRISRENFTGVQSVIDSEYQYVQETSTKNVSDRFTPVTFGTTVSADYSISKLFTVGMCAQRDFTKLYQESFCPSTAKMNLLSLNVSYKLGKS